MRLEIDLTYAGSYCSCTSSRDTRTSFGTEGAARQVTQLEVDVEGHSLTWVTKVFLSFRH